MNNQKQFGVWMDNHQAAVVGNENEEFIITLRNMLTGRKPPLITTSDQNEFIY